MFQLLILLWTLTIAVGQQELPTLYQYYTDGGITEGLKDSSDGFTLNNKDITLYSGSIHYFRVHPDYWRDRLRKARAAGLNAVETYVPWNLHEEKMGFFDFGDGDNDFSTLLNLARFLQIAKEEDLFVLLRPGPYICSEWEFGGLPSWLLRYPGIKVRTSDEIFKHHVKLYFDQLLQQIVDYTFHRGGPIIALQVENEYGSFGSRDDVRDTAYLEFIRDLYLSNNITELFFTSDSPTGSGNIGAVPGELQTANFAGSAEANFEMLKQLQPERALMAMEYWSGWFDHWMQGNHDEGNSPQEFARVLEAIFSYKASVNFYMFHGGTTFGFLNGANVVNDFPYYHPDVSSYDYGAPLSEAGDYTEKYNLAKELIAANNQVKTKIPDQPAESVKTAYPTIEVTEYLTLDDLISQVPEEDKVNVKNIGTLSSMEMLDINGGSGQSFGLTVYRNKVNMGTSAMLQVIGHVRDIAMVLVDGIQKTSRPTAYADLLNFGFWPALNASLEMSDISEVNDNELQILVENWGRNNFGYPHDFDQRKGLWEGPVLVDGKELTDWDVTALQFKGKWVSSLSQWRSVNSQDIRGPSLFRAKFTLNDPPTDTFLDMGAWSKGAVFVNGFPLGRYLYLGPQITTYVPAPVLRQGENEVVIFEHYIPAKQLIFKDKPILGP